MSNRGGTPRNPGGLSDDATDAGMAGLRSGGRRAVAGIGRPGAGTAVHHGPVLLLPLLLLSAQLLAADVAGLPGTSRRALPAAARLHGLPALPRAALALRPAQPDEPLPRLPLLAGRLL